jgi:putative transposase
VSVPSDPSDKTVLTARCYRLETKANVGKMDAVRSLLAPYQATLRNVQHDQWRQWLAGEPFWNRRCPKHIPSELSERYKRSAQNQVVAGLDSWLALSKTVIAPLISNSSLPDSVKADLFWLNRCGFHHRREAEVPVWEMVAGKRTKSKVKRQVEPETLALLRAIAKHVRKRRVSVPRLWKTRTMLLDGTVAQVEQSKTTTFDMWVRLSTVTLKQVVRIPLVTNHHYRNGGCGPVRL